MDDRFTEGGGSGKPPKWVLRGEELLNKSTVLLEDLNGTEQRLKEKFTRYKNSPAVIKAKVNEDAYAKSHRSELNKLLAADKSNNRFIGVSSENELLIRVDNIQQINEIYKNIEQVKRHGKAISGIENINAFEPDIIMEKVEPRKDGKFVFKVRLFDFNNFQLNDSIFKLFQEFLKETGTIDFIKTVKYSNELMIHEVSLESLDSLKSFEDFSPVMSVEPMPIIEVTTDDFFIERDIKIPEPDDGTEYPVVGILDTGIADIPQLSSWKIGKRYTNYPEAVLNFSHGTFVAGILNFGDVLEGKEYTGTKGFKIFDAAVVPDQSLESISEGDLIENIREVVEKHSDNIKVWNLSIGIEQEHKNSEFSRLGVALDNIQDENDVLIIKSAGNCENFLDGKPVGRVTGGAILFVH
ncbi:S8 family serine peptidase [Rossellomorea vietnamensis]|uniref:S8 family serine peptidase n=1 Tax=Rossellomorea vietnamensis TaxID=218284 RepID=UPI000689E2D4|nr:S8 family serine peptidase [Rossellomorea vietnamensis]